MENTMIEEWLKIHEPTECDNYGEEELYKRDKLDVNSVGKIKGRKETNRHKVNRKKNKVLKQLSWKQLHR